MRGCWEWAIENTQKAKEKRIRYDLDTPCIPTRVSLFIMVVISFYDWLIYSFIIKDWKLKDCCRQKSLSFRRGGVVIFIETISFKLTNWQWSWFEGLYWNIYFWQSSITAASSSWHFLATDTPLLQQNTKYKIWSPSKDKLSWNVLLFQSINLEFTTRMTKS